MNQSSILRKIPLCMVFFNFLFLCRFSCFASQSAVQAAVITGTYTQKTYTAKNNRTMQSSGDFLLAKEFGICWFAQKPQKSITVMTETAVTLITGNTKTVIGNAENPIFKEIALIIKSLFVCDEKIIAAYLNETDSANGKQYVPKNDPLKSVVANIIVGNNAALYIESVVIAYTNGDRTEYVLKVLNSAGELTPEQRRYFEQ